VRPSLTCLSNTSKDEAQALLYAATAGYLLC